MAKKAMIEREKKRERLVAKYAAKRAELKEIANDESRPMEERFKARLKLAKLPRNSSARQRTGQTPSSAFVMSSIIAAFSEVTAVPFLASRNSAMAATCCAAFAGRSSTAKPFNCKFAARNLTRN